MDDKLINYGVKAAIAFLMGWAIRDFRRILRDLHDRPTNKEVRLMVEKEVENARRVCNERILHLKEDIDELKSDSREIRTDIKTILKLSR